MILLRRLPPNTAGALRAMARLRASLTASTASAMGSGTPLILGRLDQRPSILGEAGCTKARAGMQKFAADSIVQPDPARDLLHAGTDALDDRRVR
jgi:hypothetical protein